MAFLPIADGNPLRNIRRPWVAWGFIAANVLTYLLLQSRILVDEVPIEAAVTWGVIPAVFNGDAIRPADLSVVPDWLTLVTYSFVHGNFWHLIGNMLFLWVFADNVEDALGHFRYFLFYLACAAVAGYAFVLSDPGSQSPVIGASGAVGGNIGAYLLLHPRAKVWVLVIIPLHLRAFWVLGAWIIFQFATAFWGGGDEMVAWWAHIGGVLAGAVLVVFMRQRDVPLFAPDPYQAHVARRRQPEPPSPPPEAPLPMREKDGSRGPWE